MLCPLPCVFVPETTLALKSKASLDNLAKIITAIFFGIVGIPLAYVIRNVVSHGSAAELVAHLTALAAILLIGIVCWIFAPRYYEIGNQDLVIARPSGKIVIPLKNISTVDELPREQLRGMIRTFGVGGLFGYYGKFWAPGLGNITMHATRSHNMILIVTTGAKKIVISPDDEVFAAKLRGKIKSLAT